MTTKMSRRSIDLAKRDIQFPQNEKGAANKTEFNLTFSIGPRPVSEVFLDYTRYLGAMGKHSFWVLIALHLAVAFKRFEPYACYLYHRKDYSLPYQHDNFALLRETCNVSQVSSPSKLKATPPPKPPRQKPPKNSRARAIKSSPVWVKRVRIQMLLSDILVFPLLGTMLLNQVPLYGQLTRVASPLRASLHSVAMSATAGAVLWSPRRAHISGAFATETLRGRGGAPTPLVSPLDDTIHPCLENANPAASIVPKKCRINDCYCSHTYTQSAGGDGIVWSNIAISRPLCHAVELYIGVGIYIHVVLSPALVEIGTFTDEGYEKSLVLRADSTTGTIPVDICKCGGDYGIKNKQQGETMDKILMRKNSDSGKSSNGKKLPDPDIGGCPSSSSSSLILEDMSMFYFRQLVTSLKVNEN
ncbi:hypothetical protein Btru_008859 [Bulinus truncatus]|nr:hypothetical protein Btru_008859 [Bulinus truncatus]